MVAARMPLRIGLSARIMHSVPRELGFKGKKLQYLEQSLAHWIMSHGALVFMIPTLDTESSVRRSAVRVRDYVRALDGLVLQGGTDVSPASYSEQPARPEWAGDRQRDLYELDLLWEFIIQKKPVLGICRGAQLINVAMGGTLWQDIPSQYPNAIEHVDHDLYDELHHPLVFEPGSYLATLHADEAPRLVSSIHHQAVRELGNGIAVQARAPEDGMVEAIRWTGATYVLGVQWHPEFHDHGRPDVLDGGPILGDFLAAAAAARDGG